MPGGYWRIQDLRINPSRRGVRGPCHFHGFTPTVPLALCFVHSTLNFASKHAKTLCMHDHTMGYPGHVVLGKAVIRA